MVPAAPARDTEIAMLPRQITHQNIYRLLIAGFSLVILMLLAAAIVGLRNIQSIQENASNLVHEQDTTRHLVDELRSREKSLAEVFSILARDPDSVDAERIMSQLAGADRDIERIAATDRVGRGTVNTVHSSRTTLYSGIVNVFVTVAVSICTGLLCGEELVALGSFPLTTSEHTSEL